MSDPGAPSPLSPSALGSQASMTISNPATASAGGGGGGPGVDNFASPASPGDEAERGRFAMMAAETPGGAGAAASPASPTASEKRQFLQLANEQAFGKLESHLREYVRSVPFRPAPTYVPPGAKPPDQTRPSKYNPEWDQVFERDPQAQDTLNHSASFRYCTQKLAIGFHAPYEADRRVVEYKDFTRILSVPNPTNYETLDPHVEDMPEGESRDGSPGGQSSSNFPTGTGGANVHASKFLESRIKAAKRKGVALSMSRSEMKKELQRMDAEDAHDKDVDEEELVRQRQAEREAQRAAEARKKEEEDARKHRHQVVNMYDLPDWRHCTGRALVSTISSWKTATSSSYIS